jgi:hypothetical protein
MNALRWTAVNGFLVAGYFGDFFFQIAIGVNASAKQFCFTIVAQFPIIGANSGASATTYAFFYFTNYFHI